MNFREAHTDGTGNAGRTRGRLKNELRRSKSVEGSGRAAEREDDHLTTKHEAFGQKRKS